MRHMLNARKNARARPHKGQRLDARTENFDARFAFAIIDFLAIKPPTTRIVGQTRNGTPRPRSSSRACSSVVAVVTKEMFIPLTFFTLSYSISGKMICSVKPME